MHLLHQYLILLNHPFVSVYLTIFLLPRLIRAEKLVKEGYWKKADKALNDGKMLDLYKNGKWELLKTKFPNENGKKLEMRKLSHEIELDEKEVKQIIINMNKQGSAGMDGIENKTVIWMAINNATTKITQAVVKLIKKIVTKGLIDSVRELIGNCEKGIPLAKEKNGEQDGDVRPILIANSLYRAIDNVIVKLLIGENMKKDLVGPYQMVGKKH